MGKKENMANIPYSFPMLKTAEQMSKVCGIGENHLKQLMDDGELEYVRNGNRRLIADEAIWDWYNRSKVRNKQSLSLEVSIDGNNTKGSKE